MNKLEIFPAIPINFWHNWKLKKFIVFIAEQIKYWAYLQKLRNDQFVLSSVGTLHILEKGERVKVHLGRYMNRSPWRPSYLVIYKYIHYLEVLVHLVWHKFLVCSDCFDKNLLGFRNQQFVIVWMQLTQGWSKFLKCCLQIMKIGSWIYSSKCQAVSYCYYQNDYSTCMFVYC